MKILLLFTYHPTLGDSSGKYEVVGAAKITWIGAEGELRISYPPYGSNPEVWR